MPISSSAQFELAMAPSQQNGLSSLPPILTPNNSSTSLTSTPRKKSSVTSPSDLDPELWDSGQEWILIFDNLLKHPRGKVRGCRCDMCEVDKGQMDDLYTFQRSRSGRFSLGEVKAENKREFHSDFIGIEEENRWSQNCQNEREDGYFANGRNKHPDMAAYKNKFEISNLNPGQKTDGEV